MLQHNLALSAADFSTHCIWYPVTKHFLTFQTFVSVNAISQIIYAVLLLPLVCSVIVYPETEGMPGCWVQNSALYNVTPT